MNHKELYRKTFSRLHASEDLEMEDILMKKKKFRLPKVAACLTAAFVFTSVLGVGAYAAVSGNFLGTVKVLLNGKSENVDFYQQEDGSFLGRMETKSDKKEDIEVWITSDQDFDTLSDEISSNDGIQFDINPEKQPTVTEKNDHILISYQEEVLDITEELNKNGYYEYKYNDENGKKKSMMVLPADEEGNFNTAFSDIVE